MLFRKVAVAGVFVVALAGVLWWGKEWRRKSTAPESASQTPPSSVAPKAEPPLPEIETPNPWFTLSSLQRSLTRKEFQRKLENLFDPFDAMQSYMDINDQHAVFFIASKARQIPVFTLEFAPDATHAATPPRRFRLPSEIRLLPKPPGKPLSGLRVAIDPGHIGGKWAQVENRSTRYRGSAPINEGDLNVITARILKKQLTDLGATVFLVREDTNPVTPFRPADFMDDARRLLLSKNAKLAARLEGKSVAKQNEALGEDLQETANFLFYRGSEIPERGNKIRREFQPDITITLYLNATPGSSRNRLTPLNRNIFFVHGSYTREELADPVQRRQLVTKLLENTTPVEVEVAAAIAKAFKAKTGFPPVLYGDSRTTRLIPQGGGYVVARNLAANRNYPGPVVCTEPYFMNQVVTYRRLLAGDYDGTKTFDGKPYRSLFRDYADAVTDGLIHAYGPQMVNDNPEKEMMSTSRR